MSEDPEPVPRAESGIFKGGASPPLRLRGTISLRVSYYGRDVHGPVYLCLDTYLIHSNTSSTVTLVFSEAALATAGAL